MHECPAGTNAAILALVNQQRAANNKAPLNEESHLDWSARAHTIMMAQQQVLTHDGWSDTIVQSGYHVTYMIAENIAVGYPSPDSVMNAWMNSSGHRANILSASLRDIGISCVADQNGARWWTQDFGG